MPRSTPWGAAQSVVPIVRGISDVSTSSHGGLMVSRGLAERRLSKEALRYASSENENYYFFEQDSAFLMPLYELDEVQEYFLKGSDSPHEVMMNGVLKNLSLYHCDYLLDRAIEPTHEEFTIWNNRKIADQMRKNKNPDLVVAATSGGSVMLMGITVLTTADRQTHHVKAESYDNTRIPNLLSACESVNPPEVEDRLGNYIKDRIKELQGFYETNAYSSERRDESIKNNISGIIWDHKMLFQKEGKSDSEAYKNIVNQGIKAIRQVSPEYEAFFKDVVLEKYPSKISSQENNLTA